MIERVKSVPLGRIGAAGVRMLSPSVAATLVQDGLGLGRRPRPDTSERHLAAALDWLCGAQDACGGRGVSAGFSFVNGWLAPHPEGTGRVIRTMFDNARRDGREALRERACRLADWAIEVQLPTGAVQGGLYLGRDADRWPSVSATAQVILGWCRAYAETREERYLAAARLAGNWLIAEQARDGSWRDASPAAETKVHAYDVRAGWALLELGAGSGDRRYAEAGRRAVEWALAQQRENGWFENNALSASKGRWALPHAGAIVAVADGLLGAYPHLEDPRCVTAAARAAAPLLEIFEAQGRLPGEFDAEWQSPARGGCPAGDAQVAGLWLRVYLLFADAKFLRAGVDLNHFVKAAQSLKSSHAGVRGGVKSSQPLAGRSAPYTYSSAGAAAFAESLALEAASLERRGIVMET